MDNIKTEALGFLHVLPKNPDLTYTWVNESKWSRFFEHLENNDTIDALNSIGGYVEGTHPSNQADNEAQWKTVTHNVLHNFIKCLHNIESLHSDENEIQDQKIFELPLNKIAIEGSQPQYVELPYLALILAKIVFDKNELKKYKANPRGYFDDLPAPIDEKYQLSDELKDKLAALATADTKDDIDEQTVDLMVSQYFTEQPDIW